MSNKQEVVKDNTDTTQETETKQTKEEALYGKEKSTEKTNEKTSEVKADGFESSEEGTKDKEEKPVEKGSKDGKDDNSVLGRDEKTEEVKKEVPEKYDLKLQKDSLLDADHIERIAEYAKKQGLSNDEAQAVLERDENAVSTFQARQTEELEKLSKNWINDARADKEYGGKDFDKNIHLANQVIRKFASPELQEILVNTRYGNHPELIRVFTKIGKAMGDDTLELGGQAPAVPKSNAQLLYGDNK